MADMSIRRHPLGVNLRVRNFRHLLRYRQDARHLQQFGWARFLETYLEAAALAPRERRGFLELLRKSPAWPSPVGA